MRVLIPCITPVGTKLCHARAGDVVQLLGESTDGEVYLVTLPESTPQPRNDQPEGLYVAAQHVQLVNLRTGSRRAPPSLSTRVKLFRDAEVYVGEAS